MKAKRWQDVRRSKLSAAQIEANDQAIEQEVLEMNLRELRAMAGKTQEEVAAATQALQPALSRLEHGQDHKLSSLRRYVEALGGELEVAAVFGPKRVKLSGV
jgi:transcriptional regulator with XRE-family HTH domain